ncbi:AAA family ATPase [Clostridium sp.]|uniref:AAA family ATPase n=1 Tax=Clostridium sp. TaxID=1506 RepID=UPI0025FCFD64|nr:AAA family ATPase [Clostridium sp.]MDY2632911.1 AAA family ATPase [Clostridium sp.]
MSRPRVIIADADENYIVPLQLKFVKDFFDQIDLEIITDKVYFDEFFRKPQKAEILIVSDELYNPSLQRHNISNIFMMTEQYEDGYTADLNVTSLFKYTSVKEIFSNIVSKSSDSLNFIDKKKKETQIVVVTSASGGVGKTTVAMGVSACLTKNFKKVLYINASRLQSFQYMLENQMPITSPEVYTNLANPGEQIYSELKHVIRREMFSYLPAFKASLMSVGLKYSVFEKIAMSAKESNEHDFIVIDVESTFDEDKTRLLDIADKVIIVTEQSVNAVNAVNALISNINGTNSDKYVFVCNKFDKENYNALISPEMTIKFTVNEYVDNFKVNGTVKFEELSQKVGIRKVSFLVI